MCAMMPHDDKPVTPSADDKAYTLPNGQSIYHRNQYETDFIYKEIFGDRIYLKNNIQLDANACVIDIGANIGLFSLFVMLECPTAQVYVFEPARDLFRLVQLNLQQFGASVRLFPVGMGDSDKEIDFTYYPGYSIMSGFHADQAKDKEVLAQGVKHQLQAAMKNPNKVNERMVDAVIGNKLDGAVTYKCQVTSLANVIATYQVAAIDLLKIDAEKCEIEILDGIRGEDWAKIKQIVIEAHDLQMTQAINDRLTRHGFTVVMVQEDQFESSEIYNIYARKEDVR